MSGDPRDNWTCDSAGREYAKFSDVIVGSYLDLDDEFGCMSGRVRVEANDEGKLYVSCKCGHYMPENCAGHPLTNQLNDVGYLIGMYPAAEIP